MEPTISAVLARLPHVLHATGYSRSSLFSRVSDGTFPRPVKLGPGRAVAFPVAEVHAVIRARIAGMRDSDIRALVKDLHAARGAISL